MSIEKKRELMKELLEIEYSTFMDIRENIEPTDDLTAEEIQDCFEVMEYIHGEREQFSDEIATYVDGDEILAKWGEVSPTFYGAGLIQKATKVVKNKFPTLVNLVVEN